jgi:hypothetical protein
MPARLPIRTATALIAVAAALTACSSGNPDRATAPVSAAASSTSSPSGRSPAPSTSSGAAGVQQVALSAPVDHAHGLVVREDGSLLVGTHTGLRSVGQDGTAAKVGSGDDDLMGLTGVPGSSRLISSGHPGESSSMPNPLGLISSKDGGRTWAAKSLAGQVDFHALATDGDLIAGFDGMQGIRTSRDGGTTWTQGAAIAATALAITPGSVWATTERGLQRSTDNAQSFTVVNGAPVLRLIAAGQDGSLWGVDLQGSAWRSRDGLAWQQRGQVGQVDAIAAAGHSRAYAITASQLHILS